MARRRIERLQGVQFCRRTMEIRSEVSGPPDCVRGAWTEKEAFVRLLIFGSGGLGLRRTHSTAVVIDTPENRGMIRKVSYLLKVEEA